MNNTWAKRTRIKAKYWFDLIFSNGLKINILQASPFWIGSILVGLIAVLYTKMFVYSENFLQQVLHWRSWMIFIMAPLCFLLAWLIIRVASPNAGGSGIPQVMAAIELSNRKSNNIVKKLLSVRVIICKIGSSMLMVMGGGAIGREGPTIQIAASVFRIINSVLPVSWPKLSKQSFILTGAAAGLAAAFNTPLGGIIFAIEELSRAHIRFFRTALFTAVIIAGLTAQGLLGPYLYLGYPDVGGLGYGIFFGVALTAISGGMLGALMSRCILWIIRWKKRFSVLKSVLYVLTAGMLIALISYFINGHILGSGKDIMNNLLFTPEKNASWDTVLSRITGPLIAFNTGGAGGIFAPSLAAGASLGAFIAQIFHVHGAIANILILSGMVGFLTGVTRTPFTSAILVLEMTDRHNVIFHLMIAGLLSNLGALLIEKKSLYERLKEDYLAEGKIPESTGSST